MPAEHRRRPAFATAYLLGGLLTITSPLPAAESFDDSRILRTEHPAWFKESFLDLREDLSDALAAGKQGLMLYFGTEGCAYCKAFITRSLGDPEIARTVRVHFDTLGFEIFSDDELSDLQGRATRVKHFARQQQADFAPTVAFYGAGGKRLLRLVGYQTPERFRAALDYVIQGRYRQETLRAYLQRTAPPVSASGTHPRGDELFTEPPYMLDRRVAAERPLLVLFEEADCQDCERFHAEVLSDSKVRELLARLEVVQLDSRDTSTPVLTPAGQRTRPADWFEQLGLTHMPAMVFFDEGGNEVLRIDALVLNQRMRRTLEFVVEKAYEKGHIYQSFTRQRTREELGLKDTPEAP